MVFVKALLSGLVVVSLCMADISGIVTDTGTTPISGAAVQLENGGQTATTGADGSFRLIISSAILPINGKLLPNGLSAKISGNMLNITIAERSAVEVTTFDLNGKALSGMCQTMDAGTHSISLPQRGAGIYLYKIKSGSRVVVLKGNSVDGVSTGSGRTAHGSSSNSLAKKTKSMAVINDVIAATKTGYLNYRCVQYTFDTTGLKIKMIASAGTLTDTDGNVYQTVKIGNQEWMAENLRVTRYNNGAPIPFDTTDGNWLLWKTPLYCYYNNSSNSDTIRKYGALYNWYTISPENPQKIAPAGWHVPTTAEWIILEKYLILNGYNWDGTTDTSSSNKIGQPLAAKADWCRFGSEGEVGYDLTINNKSGFSALPGGYRFGSSFKDQGEDGYWWSATEYDALTADYRFLYCRDASLGKYNYTKTCGHSIRLLRDN